MSKSLAENKNWVLLVGAVVLAGIAFWLTHSYLKHQELRLAESMRIAPPQTQRVIVASRQLNPGEVVGQDSMSIAEFPVSAVSPAAITPQTYKSVEGYMVKYPMASGEPLLTHHIDQPVVNRFSQLLNEGERAVSFTIDSLSSISGMLMPGDYIDILVEYQEPMANGTDTELKIKPLIQRVRVLAVDEMPLMARDQVNIPYGTHSLKYGSITVAAPYRDAVALTVAKHSHDIRFLLRNEEDERLVASTALGGYELVSDRGASSGRGSYLYYSNMTAGQAPLIVETSTRLPEMESQSMLRKQLKITEVDDLKNEN